jgi:hypothetical protein
LSRFTVQKLRSILLWEDITSELEAQSSNLDWLNLHLSLKTFPISEVVQKIAASANDFDSWKKYTKLNNEVRGALLNLKRSTVKRRCFWTNKMLVRLMHLLTVGLDRGQSIYTFPHSQSSLNLKAGHKENHREGIERIKPGLNLLSTDPYLVGVWVSSLYTTVIYTSTYSYTVCCDQSNGKPLT